jgi:hypothetical protein
MVQCRKFGINLFLANHTNSQLRERDQDIHRVVFNNTKLKFYFNAQDEEEIRELQQLSKTASQYLLSWTSAPFISPYFNIDDEMRRTGPRAFVQNLPAGAEQSSETWREQRGPSLELNDILDVDARKGRYFLIVREGNVHTDPFPVDGCYLLSKEAHEAAKIRPLPLRPQPSSQLLQQRVATALEGSISQPNLPATPTEDSPYQEALERLWRSVNERLLTAGLPKPPKKTKDPGGV